LTQRNTKGGKIPGKPKPWQPKGDKDLRGGEGWTKQEKGQKTRGREEGEKGKKGR